MSIADWFRPKWKHSNRHVREVAVESLTDQRALAYVAKNDEVAWVRRAAVERVTDQSLLADIAKNDPSEDVRRPAVERVTDQGTLADIAKSDRDYGVCVAAVRESSASP